MMLVHLFLIHMDSWIYLGSDKKKDFFAWNFTDKAEESLLYNLYKDSCPLIGWIAFIILTIYRIKWQNILLHSVWVGKSAKIIYYCTHRSHLY